MRIIPIVSPINGLVSNIGDDFITIYVDVSDDHTLFAPTDGVIENITSEQGSWTRDVFQAKVNKIARTSVYIKNEYLDKSISFWVEVGKPKYVTDRVQIIKKINDNVSQSERIGEIILGSLVEVHLDDVPTLITVDPSTKVTGGQTVIGYAFSVKDTDKVSRLNHLIRNMNKSDIVDTIQNDTKQLIILTTPHELCVDVPNKHNCDKYAKKLAEQLAGSLQNESRKIIIIHGNINRNYIDLNRSFSRYLTQFRSIIRTELQTHINKLSTHTKLTINNIIYIIDCHSFPSNESFRTVRVQNPEVALIFDNSNDFIFIQELYELLNENAIKTVIFPGIKNDIIDEAADITRHDNIIKIIPILVEINESVSNEQLKKISNIFGRWIIKINEYLIGKIDLNI